MYNEDDGPWMRLAKRLVPALIWLFSMIMVVAVIRVAVLGI